MSKLLTFEIDAAVAVECGDLCGMESGDDHPNKSSFTGTLLVVDEPSTRPPNGADGHRILVPKDVAKKNLGSLIGMGINYQPNKLQGHNPRHKVGVITKAWIQGNQVKCSGIIYAKDFPEAAKELKGSNIGMSMELANVLVKNKNDNVWKLIDFSFTGATALYKNSAAYQKTSLAAMAAVRELQSLIGGVRMSDKKKKSKNLSGSSRSLGNLVTAIGKSVQNGLAEGLKPFGAKLETIAASVKEQGELITEMAASQAAGTINAGEESSAVESSASSVKASADSGNDEEDELAAAASGSASSSSSGKAKGGTVKAKKAKDYDDSSDDDSSSLDDDIDSQLAKLSAPAKGTKAGPDEESADPDLGQLNKNAKSKGHKTSVNAAAVIKTVRSIAASATKRIDTLKASEKKTRKKLHASIKKQKELETELEEVKAQVDNFTETMTPKALPADVRMLLQKGGFDINELQASGRKLTVAEVDEMFASSKVTLSPMERMTMKNHLLEKDLMEQGEMDRRQLQ
jgi:hypothetical protein